MTSKTYCFKDVPQNVEDDLEAFNSENIRIENCSQEDTEVCFSGSCDIMVNCDCEYDEYTGFVQKNNKKMYFVGNLLFAAIFSDKEIYDCNVERLFYRASKVAEVFSKKADLMNSRNCGTNLQADLLAWSAMLKKAKAEDIGSLFDASKNLGEKNEIELCSIW
jgi:DNA polymerase III delta prime subunit